MDESQVTTLLLADDYIFFRDGLREVIGHWDEFQVVGEASNGQEAIERYQQLLPDIVLMDVQMPVMSGVEATRRIRLESPATLVVMLTISAADRDLFDAIKAGAHGYIPKNISARQLREQLNEVLHDESSLSGPIATEILAEFSERWTDNIDGSLGPLLARETQILQLVAEGLTNDEIGDRLALSGQMVKKRLYNVIQKLYLNNRVEAAVRTICKERDE